MEGRIDCRVVFAIYYWEGWELFKLYLYLFDILL